MSGSGSQDIAGWARWLRPHNSEAVFTALVDVEALAVLPGCRCIVLGVCAAVHLVS